MHDDDEKMKMRWTHSYTGDMLCTTFIIVTYYYLETLFFMVAPSWIECIGRESPHI